MFYKYTTDITYITESGKKKNKQARTWVSPKRKKGEVLALFRHSVAIMLVHPNKIPTQLPGLLTHPLTLADLFQQLPLSEHCLSLTVANSYLLIALRPCLSLSFSDRIGNLVHKPFVWVSRQNRRRNPLTSTHPHPQNECPPLCPIWNHLTLLTYAKLNS